MTPLTTGNSNDSPKADLVLAAAQLSGAGASLKETLPRHLRLARKAAENACSLIFFPELSLGGYHLRYRMQDVLTAGDLRLAPLQRLADECDIRIAVGTPLAATQGINIGLLCLRPSASPLMYRKRFLGQGEQVAFTPGTGGKLLRLADQELAFAICADITHPEHALDAATSGARIYAASCLVSHKDFSRDGQFLKNHASEHGMLVLLANYAPPVPDWHAAGRSAAWLPDGQLLVQAHEQGEALVIVRSNADHWSGDCVLIQD